MLFIMQATIAVVEDWGTRLHMMRLQLPYLYLSCVGAYMIKLALHERRCCKDTRQLRSMIDKGRLLTDGTNHTHCS